MKFFKAIAATAAVITCCIGNSTPAEARNGWILAGRNHHGVQAYAKITSRDGDYVYYLFKRSNDQGDPMKYVADCNRWRYRSDEKYVSKEWRDVMPSSTGEMIQNSVCR